MSVEAAIEEYITEAQADADQPTQPTPISIKALSIHNPYAGMIALNLKRYETRSWYTGYRGPIAIHASSNRESLNWLLADRRDPAAQYIRSVINADVSRFKATHLLGGIIAVGVLSAIYKTKGMRGNIDEKEELVGNYADGRSAWEITRVKLLDAPVIIRGQQNLWDWTPTGQAAVIVAELMGA